MEITDRKQALDQAVRSESLLRRLIDVQEREKQQLCHEFHDGLMQCAIAARMVLEAWRHGHPGTDAAAIDEAIGCLGDGIADGRRAIRGIRPAVLDDLGLKAVAPGSPPGCRLRGNDPAEPAVPGKPLIFSLGRAFPATFRRGLYYPE